MRFVRTTYHTALSHLKCTVRELFHIIKIGDERICLMGVGEIPQSGSSNRERSRLGECLIRLLFANALMRIPVNRL